MAYAHRQNLYGGAAEGYVRYDVSPPFGTVMGALDRFTVTGEACWRDGAPRAVTCQLGASGVDAGGVSCCIARGRAGKFTLTGRIPEALCQAGGGEIFDAALEFTLWTQPLDEDGAPGGAGAGTVNGDAAQRFAILSQREAPRIDAVTLGDGFGGALNPDTGGRFAETPLERFGGYAQGVSLPIFRAEFALDGRDAKLSATHRLTLSGGTLEAPRVFEAETAPGVGAAVFQLAAPDYTGEVRWEYILTDSAGLSASMSGEVTVWPYAPPRIDAFSVERCAVALTAEGSQILPADDGEHVRLTLQTQVCPVAGRNAWTLTLEGAPEDAEQPGAVRAASGEDGGAFHAEGDEGLFPARLPANVTGRVTATLTDCLGQARAVALAMKAGAILDVEPHGVAVGMRSTADEDSHKLEIAGDYAVVIHGRVAAETTALALNPLVAEESPWCNGALRARRIGDHVWLCGGFHQVAATGVVATLPEGYYPAHPGGSWDVPDARAWDFWRWGNSGSGGYGVKMRIDCDTGEMSVIAVRNLSGGAETPLLHVDMNMEYWTD